MPPGLGSSNKCVGNLNLLTEIYFPIFWNEETNIPELRWGITFHQPSLRVFLLGLQCAQFEPCRSNASRPLIHSVIFHILLIIDLFSFSGFLLKVVKSPRFHPIFRNEETNIPESQWKITFHPRRSLAFFLGASVRAIRALRTQRISHARTLTYFSNFVDHRFVPSFPLSLSSSLIQQPDWFGPAGGG